MYITIEAIEAFKVVDPQYEEALAKALAEAMQDKLPTAEELLESMEAFMKS